MLDSNSCDSQTADTFRAAATFLDMLSIWGALEQEITAKSKFAKYHALRIAKALKAGEDPNLSNPVQEAPPATSPSALNPNDLEVQRINGPHYQSYFESAPDTSSARPSPAISAARISPPPPNLPSAPTGYSDRPTSPPQFLPHRDVSPISPPSTSRQGSVSSAGGGYFPRVNVPTFTADNAAPGLPTALLDDEGITPPYQSTAPTQDPQHYYQSQDQNLDQNLDQNKLVFPVPQPQFHPQPPQPPQNMYQNQYQQPPPPQQQQQMRPRSVYLPQPSAPAPQLAPVQQPDHEMGSVGATNYRADEEALLAAQKHAKWAVSALNFEDVDTAVKELRIALRALGAS